MTVNLCDKHPAEVRPKLGVNTTDSFSFLDRILAVFLSGFLKTCLLNLTASHQKKAKTRSCWSDKPGD